MIKNMTISIKNLTDIYNFVAEASKVEQDVIIKRGKFIIDAKSILGIFSIDMSQEVVVSYPESATDFENFISQFKIN